MSRFPQQVGTWITHHLGNAAAVRWAALANIVANVAIVITGGAVRLTGSGLGCPNWPKCTADSYTTTDAMGINGAIEFGNRLLTFVLGAIAVIGIVSALAQRPRRRAQVRLAVLVFAGIPAQGVVGGITVLTDLNPWVVGCHFLVSMAVLVAAYAFWRAADGDATDGDAAPTSGPTTGSTTGPTTGFTAGSTAWPAPGAPRGLAVTTLVTCAVVLVLGVVVTGSGPHAGDVDAPRNGLDPQAMSRLHADGVFLLLGLSLGLWFALRATGRATRAVTVLLVVEFGQGVIGFVQYVTDLPEILVAAHMAGSCAVWLATLAAYWGPRPEGAPRPADPIPADPTPADPVTAGVPRRRPGGQDGDAQQSPLGLEPAGERKP